MVEAAIDGSIFHQNSSINATVCFTFTTVNDNIVEGDETFEFIPSASNILDKFAEGYDEFSLVVYDDDGTYYVAYLMIFIINSTVPRKLL